MSKKYNLAVLTSHPIQYQTPLFKKISEHPKINLSVYFCWDFGVKKESYNPEFGVKLKWDVPLLEGFSYKFIPNYSPRPNASFFGLINPLIIKELKRNKFDAIWINGYASCSSWLAFLGAWISKTPIIFRGESHLLNYRPAWRRFIKKMLLFPLFSKIFTFLPIGTLNADYYRHYGVPANKMFHTPYAVDNDFFSGKYEILRNEREMIKAKLGIVSDMPVILYVSKMTPRKRAGDLLAAFKKVQNKINAALVMVGDGMERAALESYVRNNNINNVFFTGFKNQTELPEYYAMSDVFVLPSQDEPWGLVINEAMNFGLPIITTDQVGAAYDLVKYGENGFIYPVGNIEKLAGYLLDLSERKELRQRMGNKSQDLICKYSFKEDIRGIISSLEYVTSLTEKK